jgi:hypothetical protein
MDEWAVMSQVQVPTIVTAPLKVAPVRRAPVGKLRWRGPAVASVQEPVLRAGVRPLMNPNRAQLATRSETVAPNHRRLWTTNASCAADRARAGTGSKVAMLRRRSPSSAWSAMKRCSSRSGLGVPMPLRSATRAS